MPSFELLTLALLVAAVAAASLVTWVALARSRPTLSDRALDQGDFGAVLESVDETTAGPRELLSLAAAAKHALDLDRADRALTRLLADDPDHGEAWIERGLVAAYAGRHDEADSAFRRASACRSDLSEPIQLHRAWTALDRGGESEARRLFDEIAAPIESKLRRDIGGGDPFFAEWYAQAAALWAAAGEAELAEWARSQALTSAPTSGLVRRLCDSVPASSNAALQ